MLRSSWVRSSKPQIGPTRCATFVAEQRGDEVVLPLVAGGEHDQLGLQLAAVHHARAVGGEGFDVVVLHDADLAA